MRSFFRDASSVSFWAIGSLIACLLWSGLANAGYIGNTIHGLILFPTTSSVDFDMGDPVVTGSGDTFNASFSNFRIDFTDTTITIIAKNSFSFASGGFNGFGFENTDGQDPLITNVVIDAATTQPGFNAADLSFDSNDIFVNNAGLSGAAGDKMVLDVTFGSVSVPEPRTLLLLSTALVVFGWSRRKPVKWQNPTGPQKRNGASKGADGRWRPHGLAAAEEAEACAFAALGQQPSPPSGSVS
jgi:hypothetical protein